MRLSHDQQIPTSVRAAFTLVELVVVVVIIAILAAVAAPKMMTQSSKSAIAADAEQLRRLDAALTNFYLKNSVWPSSSKPGLLPDGMGEFINGSAMASKSLGGSQVTWTYESGEPGSGILSGERGTCSKSHLAEIDKIVDDGELTTGRFQITSSGWSFTVFGVPSTTNDTSEIVLTATDDLSPTKSGPVGINFNGTGITIPTPPSP